MARREINLWAVAREHLALIAAAVPALLATLKVARVSDFDLTTADGLVSTSNPVEILMATVVGAIPIVLAYATVALIYLGATNRLDPGYAYGYGIPLLLLVLILVEWWVAVFLAGLVVLSIITVRISRGREALASMWLSGLLVIAMSFILTTDDPWLPAERIDVGRREPVVGFVLKENDRWTTVLESSPRRLRVIATERIQSRDVCSEHGTARSLVDLVRGSDAEYDRC